MPISSQKEGRKRVCLVSSPLSGLRTHTPQSPATKRRLKFAPTWSILDVFYSPWSQCHIYNTRRWRLADGTQWGTEFRVWRGLMEFQNSHRKSPCDDTIMMTGGGLRWGTHRVLISACPLPPSMDRYCYSIQGFPWAFNFTRYIASWSTFLCLILSLSRAFLWF